MRPAQSVLLRLMPTLALMILAGPIGCGSGQGTLPTDEQYPSVDLTSTAFSPGQPIPQKYTGEGVDVSPPLSWSGLPEGTRELALICDDPDAPRGTWVHWVLYKIPATATGLPEDFAGAAPRQPELQGVVEGINSFGQVGYGGPMPPPGHGVHHYVFSLYALDRELDGEPGLDKPSLLEAIEGHILGKGELTGTCER